MEQDLAEEAFLRGCHNRSAAYAAAEKDPMTLQEGLEEVQNSAVDLKAFGWGSMAALQVSFAGQEDDDEEVNTQVNEDKFKDLFTRLMREYQQAKGERDLEGFSSRREHVRASSAIRCYRCGGRGKCPENVAKNGGGALLAVKLATCVQTVLVSKVCSHPAEAEARRGILTEKGRTHRPSGCPSGCSANPPGSSRGQRSGQQWYSAGRDSYKWGCEALVDWRFIRGQGVGAAIECTGVHGDSHRWGHGDGRCSTPRPSKGIVG